MHFYASTVIQSLRSAALGPSPTDYKARITPASTSSDQLFLHIAIYGTSIHMRAFQISKAHHNGLVNNLSAAFRDSLFIIRPISSISPRTDSPLAFRCVHAAEAS